MNWNNEVICKFDNSTQAKSFMQWLSNSGEQEYFEQKEYEDELDAEICDKLEYDWTNHIINFSKLEEDES